MIKVTISCAVPIRDDENVEKFDEETRRIIEGDNYKSPEDRDIKVTLDWRIGYINAANIISVYPNTEKDEDGKLLGGSLVSFNDTSDAQMYVAESVPEIISLIKDDRGGLLHDIAMEILKIIDYVSNINKQVKPKTD